MNNRICACVRLGECGLKTMDFSVKIGNIVGKVRRDLP